MSLRYIPFNLQSSYNPADRIIVATVAILGVPLVTRDERILFYLRKTKITPVIAR